MIVACVVTKLDMRKGNKKNGKKPSLNIMASGVWYAERYVP